MVFLPVFSDIPLSAPRELITWEVLQIYQRGSPGTLRGAGADCRQSAAQLHVR